MWTTHEYVYLATLVWRPFMLLWPWPWLDDLDARSWPIYFQDLSAH